MRIVLTGGGTGGHIYPALAIGKQAEEEDPGTSLLYIGTPKGMESRIVPEHGVKFESVEITGFRRKLSLENFKTVMRFLRGVRRSKELLRSFKPDVVVGTGGYVCGPVVYAAAKLGIPTIIHEQNADPGLTNKFLARYVDCVAVSFKESIPSFNKAKRIVHTGNPCASNVVRANREKGYASLGLPLGSRIVLMVGGSRGAKAMNDAMVDMGPLLQRLPNVHFVFVTGESYYEQTMERMKKVIPKLSNYIHVLPYLHNMPEVLAATTLVVSRSGASSLAEVTALGIPSILIPSPNVTNNHQEANARSIADAGAAEMIVERNLNGEMLFERIQAIMTDPGRLASMGKASHSLGIPQSASLINGELIKLVKKR
ncbi:undecaprenyldiphospho-muramoylpentapeptide beta-N-acetylglucosaminyltransferase [Paenibacillus spongiae]|uniref:UDP-N-acetylglucosamine--N-acetylmuramyl-(pentapeptide) pyrophosphoryl-undecaprenol N-acetylglucosamine transferase n=1 Tax=Paenibacillus spongiae TaxID=2909671 RepID=A0ABY5SE07_9BACL|nr:undecaprenyldiphospho-muramoylpentapeptide beta-N-acetylglucosaminyltransferase [Paenibacillus spongiae]UVI32197.1 undecaprenyldiphospho-muramoylpentapeptide beta-N-acetylglucosaminyltransferase [Paenibacillus spongiae]